MSSTRITPQLVQAVRDAVDIVDVAGDMTRLEKKGKQYKGLCPFHKEKSPSFSVDPVQGLFYCFGCGAGGDTIKLFMEQTGDDFPAAIESLARRYGIPLPAAPTGGSARQERDLGAALEAAAEFFEQQLGRSAFAQGYLDKRQISSELQSLYGLGYAPDGWDHLQKALRGRVPLDDLIAAGLVGRSQRTDKPYDRFRQRLMFPIHTPGGRLVGFGGRTLGDDRAKYVNTSETEHFHKGNLLYGFHQAKRVLREGGKALLVEGYFDVLGAAASGVDFSVAGMGTSLTSEQARLMSRYCDDVTIAYDGDDAGEKAFQRALPILLGAGLAARRARFPSGHDPDSWRLEAGAEAVREIIDTAEDAVWIEIRRRIPPVEERTPALQARAAETIAELLRSVRNQVERGAYSRRAAEYLGIPEAALRGKTGAQRYFKGIEAPAGGGPREVRTEEEKALALLLQDDSVLPAPDQLPTPEVFLDPECRNIYSAFRDLYIGNDRRPPAVSDVVAKLDSESGAIDRAARLLLQDSGPGEGDLAGTLEKLNHRWRRQRKSELKRQIKQAEQQGADTRVAELLEEMGALTRSLHPGMTSRWLPPR
ncbi:MAG: DNA primase [bacterium]|nr:DNA primase [bacterium]